MNKCLASALAPIALAVALLPSSIAVANEKDMVALVAKKAAILNSLHKKAHRALVNAAQDRAFAEYFTTHDHSRKQSSREKIKKVTLNVQSKFHVEEMCLIDPTGTEITRIVGREIAPDSDLSDEEASTIFFAPGFSMQKKRVYLSPLYISPDADKWVLSYTTPIVIGGDRKAILHYEHGLEAYQAALNRSMTGERRYVLAVDPNGFVIADSRESFDTAARNGSHDLADYFKTFESVISPQARAALANLSANDRGSASYFENGVKSSVAFQRADGDWTIYAFEHGT